MSEIFSQWLHAVIYTGIVCSTAMLLTPEGRVKKALTIICAVAMCAAIASPLAELDFDAYSIMNSMPGNISVGARITAKI